MTQFAGFFPTLNLLGNTGGVAVGMGVRLGGQLKGTWGEKQRCWGDVSL